jgi:hypothetical protein
MEPVPIKRYSKTHRIIEGVSIFLLVAMMFGYAVVAYYMLGGE